MDADSAAQRNERVNAAGAAPHGAGAVDALNAYAWELREAEPGRALASALEAQALADTLDYPGGRARSLLIQGRCHSGRGDLTDARLCLEQALELSRSRDPATEADCHAALGHVFYGRADFAAALDHYRQALALSRELGDANRQANACDGLGVTHFYLADFGQALASCADALRLREGGTDKAGLARSLNNVGGMHDEMGDQETALDYYRRSLRLSREAGTRGVEVFCLGNIAQACVSLGRYDEALAVGQEAVALAQSGDYALYECRALVNWGEAFAKTGQSERALALYGQALLLAQTLPDPNSECMIHVYRGDVLWEQGDCAGARAACARAAEMAAALGLKQFAFKAHRLLSELCERDADFAAALSHLKQSQMLEREVFSEAASKRVSALMVQMQVEQTRKDAELHRLKNVDLAQANRMLQEQAELLRSQAEELRAQAEELERQATTDGLTGLHNRRSLEHFLARHFADSRRSELLLTVVMIDIDHFKGINDRFGHQTGDEVLMTVAQLLRRACRSEDFVARYGGEEFVMALPGMGGVIAREVCERARQMVEEHAWDVIHVGLSVTVSLGLSGGLAVANHERLLDLADQRLYEAKRAGRNRVCAGVQ